VQDGLQRASKFLQSQSKRLFGAPATFAGGIHAMFLTRLLQRYRTNVRARLVAQPERINLFEALLLLLLLVLLAVGIAWM